MRALNIITWDHRDWTPRPRAPEVRVRRRRRRSTRACCGRWGNARGWNNFARRVILRVSARIPCVALNHQTVGATRRNAPWWTKSVAWATLMHFCAFMKYKWQYIMPYTCPELLSPTRRALCVENWRQPLREKERNFAAIYQEGQKRVKQYRACFMNYFRAYFHNLHGFEVFQSFIPCIFFIRERVIYFGLFQYHERRVFKLR